MEKAIYMITNVINGKRYIGQSINPNRRFIAHISRAKNDSDNSPIHSAIKKYGKECFKLEILEWTENYNEREKELIQQYNTLSPNGYNVALGGEEPPHSYGEAHHNSRLKSEDVTFIIDKLKNSELSESKIGRLFDPPINQAQIHNINHGITHHRDNEVYPIRTECYYHLKESDLEEIIWLLQNSFFPMYQIAEHYHVNTSTIKALNVGRNYYNENISYPIRKHKGNKQLQPVETILAKRSTSAIDTHLEMGVCAS